MTAPENPLVQALAARYGAGNFRITEDNRIEIRRGSTRKWRRIGHVSVDGAKVNGAPKALPGGRKITLYMSAASQEQASQLGAGNLSLGVRRALETAIAGTAPSPESPLPQTACSTD